MVDFKTGDIKRHLRAGVMPLLQSTLDIALPPQCLLTGDVVSSHGALSPAAWQQLNFITEPFCPACGIPFQVAQGEGVLCGNCAAPEKLIAQGLPALIDEKGLSKVRAALVYDDVSGRLVMALKYADRLDGGAALSKIMVQAGRDLGLKGAIIVPVPLHRKRLWSRRFNQAAVLARGIAETSGGTAGLDVLHRKKDTRPQRNMSPAQRQRNVRGVFDLNPDWAERIKGRSVIIVDDVLTTGATLTGCAKQLRKAGAATVNGLVLTRIVRGNIGAI